MYHKEVEKILGVPEILNLTGDKMINRISYLEGIAPYVTYREYDEETVFETEGNPKITRYYIQIDIDGEFFKLKEIIKKLAKKARWKKGAVFEGKDPETKLLFCCLRFEFDLFEEG